MREEQTIQIQLQLPVSELAGLTTLAEHLRVLLQSEQKPTVSRTGEQENSHFDITRFRELNSAPSSTSPAVLPAQSRDERVTDDSESTGFQTDRANDLPLSALQTREPVDSTEIFYPESMRQTPPSAPSPEAKKVSPAADRTDNDPTAASVIVNSLPSDISNFSRPRQQEFSDTSASPATSSVTAETVSQAFRRDDRRYDNGFPLY